MEVDQLVTDLKDSEAEVPEAVLGQLMSSHLAVVVSMLGAAGEVSDETLLRGVV
jgi:ferric iron reductase protein FhuF